MVLLRPGSGHRSESLNLVKTVADGSIAPSNGNVSQTYFASATFMPPPSGTDKSADATAN